MAEARRCLGRWHVSGSLSPSGDHLAVVDGPRGSMVGDSTSSWSIWLARCWGQGSVRGSVEGLAQASAVGRSSPGNCPTALVAVAVLGVLAHRCDRGAGPPQAGIFGGDRRSRPGTAGGRSRRRGTTGCRPSGALVVAPRRAADGARRSDRRSSRCRKRRGRCCKGVRPRQGIRAAVTGSDIAAVLFTSGSSGVPKAVLHTHRGLAYKAKLMARVHGLRRATPCSPPHRSPTCRDF